jgi:hypothetical protein
MDFSETILADKTTQLSMITGSSDSCVKLWIDSTVEEVER